MAVKDIVVFIPGISGSVLTKHGKTVWAPQAGAALRGIFTGLRSVRSLAMDGDDHTLDDLGDGVEATGLCQDLHLIPGLWKIDGYSRFRQNLIARAGLVERETYFELPYDWRRDNRVAARKLQRLSEQWLARRRQTYPDAQLILVCHSMGGVVARIFLDMMEGWRDTRRLITLGTPYSGSFNALDNLCNGFTMGRWVLQVDQTETLASFTSVYQLLPSYRCLRHPVSGELVALDADGLDLPQIDRTRVADAMDLHRQIRDAVDANDGDQTYRDHGYRTRPIVGNFIETKTGATLSAGNIVVTSDPMGGDGTVPRPCAFPHEQLEDPENADWLNEKHGSIQNNSDTTDGIASLLLHDPGPVVFTAPDITLSLSAQDALAGQNVEIRAQTSQPTDALTCKVESIATGRVETHPMQQDPDVPTGAMLSLAGLDPGDYRIMASGAQTSVVTDLVSVVDPDE